MSSLKKKVPIPIAASRTEAPAGSLQGTFEVTNQERGSDPGTVAPPSNPLSSSSDPLGAHASDPPRKRFRIRKRELLFIFPNLFTTANLFLGFFAIISSIQGRWIDAATAILLGAITDGLDGRIARMTNAQSAFGEEYDSMSDLVSFGVAPALLMYEWALMPYGRLAWIASFLYLACAALRLARFNVLKQSAEKRYFQGCPSPLAACTVASAVLFYHSMDLAAQKSRFMLLIMFGLALAMVSSIRYRSFKDLKFKSQVFFAYVIMVTGALILFSTKPERLFFPIGCVYLVMGPLAEISRWSRRTFKWIPGTGRS